MVNKTGTSLLLYEFYFLYHEHDTVDRVLNKYVNETSKKYITQ